MRSSLLLLALLSCTSTGDDAADDAEPDTVVDAGKADAPTLAANSYEMTADRLVHRTWYKGELPYLQLLPGSTWTASVCTGYSCSTMTGEHGTYKLTITASGTRYIRFYQDGQTSYARYAYEDEGDTLRLRKSGTSDWVAMDVVPALWSESLCDATAGSWTDDDPAPDGTYCVCGAGRVWLAGTGCVAHTP